MTVSSADRAAGCLLGLAVGDALGFVVEGAPPAEAADYVRAELRTGFGTLRARPPFAAGQYSDDTQLARELLLSVCEARGFDAPTFARRIARLFAEGHPVGAGPGSRSAAERLHAGTPWHQAGTPAPYAGNGAAMRAGPLGVLYGLDPVRLGSIARDQAVVTHRDPRAIAGAVAVAGAVALAARSGPLDARSAMNELHEWVRPYDRSVADAIAQVADWIALPRAEAAARVAALADPPRRSGQGVSPFVTPSVAWSLYAFLRSPDDYRETLCTAIEVGGDTDTLAAMAGAMSGARLGLAGVPPEVVDRLTDRGLWSGTDLARLARECAGVLGGL